MKKIVFALLMLCFSTPALAGKVAGTGWETVCKVKTEKKVIGRYVTTTTLYNVCKKEPSFNVLGIRLDAGFPDVLGASLIGRPLRFFQIEAGGTSTLVGGGVKVGTSIFLPWYISPGAHFEYGHQWAGNINKLVAMFGSNPNISLLNSVEYDYLNFHGSLGFGHPNWVMFRIYAGYSYILGQTNGLQTYVQARTNQSNLMLAEASAHVWAPSAKLAFEIYF